MMQKEQVAQVFLTALVTYVFKINSSKLKGRALPKLDQLIKTGSGRYLELDCKNVSNF